MNWTQKWNKQTSKYRFTFRNLVINTLTGQTGEIVSVGPRDKYMVKYEDGSTGSVREADLQSQGSENPEVKKLLSRS